MDSDRSVIITLGKELGSGAFSTVFLGTVTSSGAAVAVKKKARVSLTVKRPPLQHEVRILQTLQGHPAIPQLVGYYHGLHFEYIAMELLGEPIKAKVKDGMGLSQETVARVGVQMVRTESLLAPSSSSLDPGAGGQLSALEHLLAKGVLHRDVKPANILLCPADASKICLVDFGISCLLAVPRPRDPRAYAKETPIVGTLDWCSLSVHEARFPMCPADDLESLAYALLFLISGSLPWRVSMDSQRETLAQAAQRVHASKQALTGDDLVVSHSGCALAETLGRLLEYARRLAPEEKPDLRHWGRELANAASVDVEELKAAPLDWSPRVPPLQLKERLAMVPPPSASAKLDADVQAASASAGAVVCIPDSMSVPDFSRDWFPEGDRDSSITFPPEEAQKCDEKIPPFFVELVRMW
ncbi:hypothetical protein HMN09_00304300 [Mycena chlorophos]|uniref:non-specific serine/threonine protein kinase n=1 Tax=Mycena chlorophos TaxID=658473 RepID=A0A8H6TM71_MYCCL|nr:hypothetical protein HMN09_00304300 [Mycena chlorophos]